MQFLSRSLPLRLKAVIAWAVIMSSMCRAESPYLIDVWSPYEGLPQSRVLSIAQTPDGYLWISTRLGWLARFDGIRFKHFNPTNTPVLVSPEIQKLMVDDSGVLWIADIDGRLISYVDETFRNRTADMPGYHRRVLEWAGRHGGESRFVTAAGMLLRVGREVTFENVDNPVPAAPESIRQFCQDEDGVLWCRTTGGRFGRWSGAGLQPLTETGLPVDVKVNHILQAAEGGLWLATTEGLWKLENGSFSRRLEDSLDVGESIDRLARSPDGGLWLLAGNKLALVRDGQVAHSATLREIAPAPPWSFLEIHADSNGGVWVLNSGEGVWHMDASGTVTLLSTGNGLPSNLVDTWFEDREKNIWLGTAAGLVRVRPRWFQLIGADGIGAGNGVVSISQDAGGDVWLGRPNGLSRLRGGVAENVPLASIRKGFPIAEVTVAPGGFPGEVWLGTVASGAMLLREGHPVHPFPYQAPGLAIRVVRRDPQGGIWFGGEFGLFRWDGERLRKFGPEDGLSPGHIHDISFDENGTPWIAKAEDLLVVYCDGRFTPWPLPGIPPSQRIHTVVCGRDGNIWLGTVGSGLLHLSKGELFRYTTEDGLPSNSVSQLLEDDDGYLWGGSLRGIFRVSTTALDMCSKGVRPPVLFQNYDHSDGLPTAECSGGLQPACWKATDGRLWFSTSTGAVVVAPGQVRKSLVPPAVVIEQMRVDGREIGSVRSPGETDIHTVDPGRHGYEFVFTGLSFGAPEKVRFQWHLDGWDNDWIEGGRQRSVSYSGLGPGNYQFSVRAANSDGVWSRESATIAFRVTPYLWQRTSVRISFVIAALALAYVLVTGFMRRKYARSLRFLEYERSLEQQRFRHKQAMEAERARIAAELHDDLGASLTQIQWLGESANGLNSYAADDNNPMARIARKSTEMVRLIDQIVWAINPKNDTLEQFVTYVCNFAEQYFRDSATRCRIDVSEDIPVLLLEADARHHLFLIAKEALHNVAKHAAAERVWVRMSFTGNVFRLIIEDHGNGFDVSNANEGDGLGNMRRRAQLAGADLFIESIPSEGTKVILLLKIDPKSN